MVDKIYSLKPNYSFYVSTDNKGYLVGDNKYYMISNCLFISILLLVDGYKRDTEIVNILKKKYTEPEIFFTFLQLEDQKFITTEINNIPKENENMFDFTVTLDEHVSILKSFSFDTYSTHDSLKSTMMNLLCHHGLEKNNGNNPKIHLCLVDDFLDEKSHELFHKLENDAITFFPIQMGYNELITGSLLNYQTGFPCWHCLEFQLTENQPVKTFLNSVPIVKMNYGPKRKISEQQIAYYCSLSLKLLAQEIVKKNNTHQSVLSVFNVNNKKYTEHIIRKIPQCVNCGDINIPKKNKLKPIVLKANKPKLNSSGGYRIISPDATWEKYKHLVSDKTGIVTVVEPFQSKNHNLRPVWHAGYYVIPKNLQSSKDELFIKKSFGKGATWQQARVSALCEAIERHCSQYQGNELVVQGSFNQLKNNDILHPNELLNFSEYQYQNRDNQIPDDPVQAVPVKFDESKHIFWTYTWSLIKQKKFLIPLSYCYSNTPLPDKEMVPFNPNGHVAGNSIEEAILQGLFELIERDAVGIWWYNRLCKNKIDISSFKDPYFIDVHKHYNQHDWDFWVLDLTTDLNIPVAVSVGYSEKYQGFIIGMGCHLDFRLAVQRAITEMHQVFNPAKMNKPLWTTDTFENSTFLFPKNSSTTITWDKYPTPKTSYIKEDLEYCLTILKSKNLDCFIIDYTRPDVQLSTVKVIVPTLRHFWRRLGPGRLYDVPFQMGWVNKKHKETDLNPITMKV